MSHLLWKYFWENDVDRFRHLLASAGPNTHASPKGAAVRSSEGSLAASPGGLGTSPRPGNKSRRHSAHPSALGRSKDGGLTLGLGRSEVNSRDHAGLTILLRAASSTKPNARDFVQALIEHPAIDLYIQDPESGWNALHRSLYSGNVSIARMLLARERFDLSTPTLSSAGKVGLLIKTKDNEGHSPFDLYNATVATRSLRQAQASLTSSAGSTSGCVEDEQAQGLVAPVNTSQRFGEPAEGGELYVFGSNKNHSLGVGDEDDRQFPERIMLRRPVELLHRFHESYLDQHGLEPPPSRPAVEDIPSLIRDRPLVIRDVVMSKLHTAILTTDVVSNLYICGVGRGGRLGVGDENTRFKFAPVQGPFTDRKVRNIALGQNHSLAVAGQGELWTWGLNVDSQLGYLLPPPSRPDEEPMSLTPRQVFGSLKKEIVLGVAASAIHSAAHTGASLYCWGRNQGQLGLMDADSRSLDVQQTPRRVAASLLSVPIEMISATDKATSCLLSNHTVWVFTNYGYNLIKFPIPDLFTNHNLASASFTGRYDPSRKDIRYITSGADIIAALTTHGDVFTIELNHIVDGKQPAGSTTNPVKIKGAVSQPQCIWDSRKDGATSVAVGEHGSIIIGTKSGAVWKRVKWAKGQNVAFTGLSDTRKKGFKFERIPCITGCVRVQSSIFGAYAAVRKDSSIMSNQIAVAKPSLCDDLGALMCIRDFRTSEEMAANKPWDAASARQRLGSVPFEILRCENLEQELSRWLEINSFKFDGIDVEIRTTMAPDIKIPVHGCILAGRSSVLRHALAEFRDTDDGITSYSDTFLIENVRGRILLTMQGVDILTLLNIVVFAYQDDIIPVWKYTRESPSEAFRFRQVRSELMKLATKLQMRTLEMASRLQVNVEPSLSADMKKALSDGEFLSNGDVTIQLDGAELTAHSQVLCQRCPFFHAIFHGRSQGRWLTSRRNEAGAAEKVPIDLKHIRPDTFEYILEHLYADSGQEMFNDVALPTLDDFAELVLDVMGVANELMLDRLSQVCQSLMGKFASTRNIANLLNEISPCSVKTFKEAGLEYVCLQLECMLENHLLDDLDEDLLQDLDEVVRDNQMARFPCSRSGRADLLLHHKYPDLGPDIEDERRRRVKEMAFRAAQRGEERKHGSACKGRNTTHEESVVATPRSDDVRRKSSACMNGPLSPSLRRKASRGDMMFSMDEDVSRMNDSPKSPNVGPPEFSPDLTTKDMPRRSGAWRDNRGASAGSRASLAEVACAEAATSECTAPHPPATPTRTTSGPWASPTPASSSRMGIKDIIFEASTKSTPATDLAAKPVKNTAASHPPAKMSQKDRKKRLQMEAEAMELALAEDKKAGRATWEDAKPGNRPAPWKSTAAPAKHNFGDASPTALRDSTPAKTKPVISLDAEQSRRRTVSPDTRFPGQGRGINSTIAASPSSSHAGKSPLVPHSKSYITPATKVGFTMAARSMENIIEQQRREQELVKEAVAKRSLQDIQQEQAFQEWWDQESRRAQEEEARRQARNQDKVPSGRGRSRKRRGGGDKSKGKGPEAFHGADQGGEGSRAPSGVPPTRRMMHGAKGKGGKH
ncbi:BTB domain and ankyrin repeat containing protein [Drechmeria coniospora]|uniref:BTB domain and ankyrin repeat containing protein n=1 Tax=Drechmeria coniospora TaxID=98403 RepID=A0A151GDI4_DRECN|nr:BTB domain and ankyrin repeat containing protein [Drechmeria coniospora]KYK55157.1 BTB domain and ankyrin repeat containing protein [Drechmeria coniospora]